VGPVSAKPGLVGRIRLDHHAVAATLVIPV
jgi:hypothetical protein